MSDLNGSTPQTAAPQLAPELLEAMALVPEHQASHGAIEALEANLATAKQIHASKATIQQSAQKVADAVRNHIQKFHLERDIDVMGLTDEQVTQINDEMAGLKRADIQDMHAALTDGDQRQAMQVFLQEHAQQFEIRFIVNVMPQPHDMYVPSSDELHQMPVYSWQPLFAGGMVSIVETLGVDSP